MNKLVEWSWALDQINSSPIQKRHRKAKGLFCTVIKPDGPDGLAVAIAIAILSVEDNFRECLFRALVFGSGLNPYSGL